MKHLPFILSVAATVACSTETDRSKPTGTSGATPPGSSIASAAVPSAAASGSASVASASASAEPLQPSPRPTSDEWTAAPESASTQGKPKCVLKIVRDWFRLACSEPASLWGQVGLGKLGETYFTSQPIGGYVLEAQARRGVLGAARIEPIGASGGTVVRAIWPTDEPRPTQVALDERRGFMFEPMSESPASDAPAVAAGESERPGPADWTKGVSVNTAPPDAREPRCEVVVVREWMRARCHDKDLGAYANIQGFGKAKEDYVAQSLGSSADLVTRLRKGMRARADWVNLGPTAVLVVEWPSDAPKPTALAFYKAGKAP